MIINPIIPVWVMVLLIPIFIVCLSHDKKKRIRQIVIIALIFLINIRIMVRKEDAEVITNDLDVLFVVDTTISMIAEDYNGDSTRLSGVKDDMKYIIEELEGAKFSIVTFDNSSKVVLPYTRDKDILYEAIDIIKVSEYMFARGTTLNASIDGMEQQLEASASKEERARIVFFISDGEITSSTDQKVDTNLFSIFGSYISDGAVLGYGTSEGGYMYVKTGDYGSYKYLDYKGKKAVSIIDEGNLDLVAKSLGVDYINMSKQSNLESKLADIKDGITYDFDVVDKTAYADTYYIFVVPLLGLLIYEFINFRRGV